MQLLSTLFSLGHILTAAAQTLADHLECEDNEYRGMCVRTEDVKDKGSENLEPQKNS